MKKTFLTLSFAALLTFSFALPAFAQSGGGNPGEGGGNPVNVPFQIKNPFRTGDNLITLMESILKDIVMPLGGVLCVLGFIFAGFQYVTAQGNQSKITKAHNTLLYAAIGTVLILGALVIETALRSTFTQLLS